MTNTTVERELCDRQRNNKSRGAVMSALLPGGHRPFHSDTIVIVPLNLEERGTPSDVSGDTLLLE